MANTLKIATRKSLLAMWQAEHVAGLLRDTHQSLAVELIPMTTEGDRRLDSSLANIGGKGLFIKELEVALSDGRADIAVHSMKDLPADLAGQFAIGAVLERADPRDVLVSPIYGTLEALPVGARVGTSSLRRRAQLKARRPDLQIEPLRGNVDTRLRRVADNEMDAIILAAAALVRLGRETMIGEILEHDVCLPAVAQGAIGIEMRADDQATAALLAPLDHPATANAVRAERAVSRGLGGDCTSPLAAHASSKHDTLHLHALVADSDGTEVLQATASSAGCADELGLTVARILLADGAKRLIEMSRHD